MTKNDNQLKAQMVLDSWDGEDLRALQVALHTVLGERRPSTGGVIDTVSILENDDDRFEGPTVGPENWAKCRPDARQLAQMEKVGAIPPGPEIQDWTPELVREHFGDKYGFWRQLAAIALGIAVGHVIWWGLGWLMS